MAGQRSTPGALLTARPAEPEKVISPGLHQLGLGGLRDGLLFRPHTPPTASYPLLVLLHGAGSDAASMLELLEPLGPEGDYALLIPDARRHTWDFLISDFGPDVQFLDRALAKVFTTCRIDPSRIGIGGFSDGASYALTLGLANGDLFTHVLAFSPGFMAPPLLQGTPRVFISHGTHDQVLPIDRCSRRIVPQLREGNYDLTYREFDGPHTVPGPILHEALQWFLQPSPPPGPA